MSLDKVKASDKVGASIGRGGKSGEGASASGYYEITCNDKDGNFKWFDDIHNLITTEGLNHLLNSTLGGATQLTVWYMAPYTVGAIGAGSTYAVPVVTESPNYDEASRPAWTEGAAAAGVMTNGTAVVMTWNSTDTVNGIELMSFATKNNTAEGGAKLFSQGAFTGGAKAMTSGDTLNITYTVTLTDT